MKCKICILAFLWPVMNVFAQENLETKADTLQVGDTLNVTRITDVINHSDSLINLSEYKDRLVLLDFWATWCTSCYMALPKLDSLVQIFGDSLNIILISSKRNPDTEEKVRNRFSRLKATYGNDIRFPVAMRDTVISQFFNIESIPLYVWLLNGRIQAITQLEPITTDLIRRMYH
jgi:thiol-disulfide isomerase/thioredoxin